MSSIVAFAVALAVFLIADALWLVGVASPLFQAEAGAVLRAEPNMAAAGAFYLLYPLGMWVLAIAPALRERCVASAGKLGAVLGLVAYGTFDLTNLAIIAGWTLKMALIDMAWGTGLTAVASAAGCAAGLWFLQKTPDRSR